MAEEVGDMPQLPLETFDSIASHIERPSDLLTLSLVCRSISAIVLTRHIKYRDVALVQLDAKDEMIWNDLLTHPDRTVNVRRLELRLGRSSLGIDGRPFIPSFSQVIIVMRRLLYLKVVETQDSSDIVVHSWELCWRHLQENNCLKTVEVSIGRRMLSSASNLGFLQLRNLKNVFLEHSGHTRSIHVFRKLQGIFSVFLKENELLENLTLKFPYMILDAAEFLRDSTLPRLRSLRCCFGTTSHSVQYMPSFMTRHPAIEVLHWDVASEADFPVPPHNTLPYLREISGYGQHVISFLACPTERPRPLHSIKNIVISPEFWATIFPLLNPRNVLKMDIEQFSCIGDIFRLVREFPNLVYLRVDLSDPIWDDSVGTWRTMKNAEWGDILIHIPNLRVIRGLAFLDDPEIETENDERIVFLSNLLPRLEFIDHWEMQHCVVRIVRTPNTDEVSWEVTDALYAESISLAT